MNYTRRARRPDGLFYRDQRRLGLSRNSRLLGGPRGLALLVMLAGLGLVIYWLFFK